MSGNYKLYKREILFFLFISLTFFYGFSQNNDVVIEGNISNMEVTKVELLQMFPKKVLAGSWVNKHGYFHINGQIQSENIYQLNFINDKYLMLVLTPGDHVNINIDGNSMGLPEVRGSKESEKLYNTIRKYNDFERKIEEYRKQQLAKRDSFIKEFLENDTSLTVLFFSDRVPVEKNIETYQKALENLKSTYPQNYFVQDLEKRLNSHSALTINRQVPEIALPNPDGDTLRLSDFRGDVVLIDFWASWCGPCRQTNPHLVDLYQKYQHKNFEIFGVSLDRNHDSWVQGIEKDSLTWPQVSDLKYWNSDVVKDFGIKGIPFTVLIDEEGIVLDKGLRGESLEKKLEEVFSEETD